MTDAPERIWAGPDGGYWSTEDIGNSVDVEYVRADVAAAMVAAALAKTRAGVNLTPQPIETAPMDGTKILVFPYFDTDEIQVSWFIEEEDRWANWNWHSDPTHWMPKPDFAKLKEDQ